MWRPRANEKWEIAEEVFWIFISVLSSLAHSRQNGLMKTQTEGSNRCRFVFISLISALDMNLSLENLFTHAIQRFNTFRHAFGCHSFGSFVRQLFVYTTKQCMAQTFTWFTYTRNHFSFHPLSIHCRNFIELNKSCHNYHCFLLYCSD